jgi:RNA polymerase sigma-70 factor (ECF subfamily)
MANDSWGDLVARWREGDQQAATELFRRYANRLIALARSRLSTKVAQRVDPEDVVQSAYRSFFAGTREGRYDLERGGDLWRLLVEITLHKLYGQVRYHSRSKRAVGREQGLGSDEKFLQMHAHVTTHEPSPVEALSLVDQLQQLMRRLLPQHRRMLELRLQGCNVDEIADATDSGERTVRRVLDRVKVLLESWQDEKSTG